MSPFRQNEVFLSVIIPVYNSDSSVVRLVDELKKQLAPKMDFEIVLVNDGSSLVTTDKACRELAEKYGFVLYVRLARNFGEHNAVMAGLNSCHGKYAVIIDDDFQNPPYEIKRMVDHALEGGYDVVYSYYDEKRHHWFRNLGSDFNNLVATVMLKKPYDLYLSSFKLLNRFLIDEVVRYSGPYPYVDGLILRTTDNIGRIKVQHDQRAEGRSNYTLRKLIRLWLNMFTNFSILPLRIATLGGLLFSLLGFLAALAVIIEKMRYPYLPAGWTSQLVSVLIMGGVQLAAIGMVGEYLGRLFLKENNQPQFVIREQVSLKETSDE